MRNLRTAVGLALLGATSAVAQRPDSTRVDSAARARADSIKPRLLPNFSAVGDLVGDLSPKGSTQEDGTRFGVREVELAVQAAVDPHFRGDFFLRISDLEKISIEQAFLTATALPLRIEARLGRFLMPVGKQNTTHRHDLHTIEHSYVVQRFLSADGLKGTGIYLARAFSPFGFYQEVILTAVDRFGKDPADLAADEPPNKKLTGLGYSARLRNYWDFSQASNLELSGSAITGRREQPLAFGISGVNAALARQTVVGVDLTYRWRPLPQGLYRSFILQGELMKQLNKGKVLVPSGFTPEEYRGPTRNFTGAYLFARYQITRRNYVGARYDWLQDPAANGARLLSGMAELEFFPREFSKLVAAFERRSLKSAGSTNRILLQASFAVGPHKPQPF
ncbi:MAG TPA: hypothetical protein VGQ73_03575 [Gemmatimonadales bacterium]|jgi:hypothetical protein|nr:hypothetical protein [Gemmatimonadales bacterium]